MELVRPPDDPAAPRRLRRASFLLGFAMGGFFDGILLHQILQWHHLLSGVQTGALGSLSAQVAMDGVFHAIMYVIAAAGLIELFRARSAVSSSAPIRPRWGHFWIGFGVWHITDALLSHWITGIHRIKMDAENLLVWDLAWFVVFGVAPLLYGWRTRHHRRPPPNGGAGKTIASLFAVAVLAGGMVNLFPLRSDADTTVIALRPGASAGAMFQALADTDARVVWSDPQGLVWVMTAIPTAQKLGLFASGAMYVSGSVVPAGCSAWLKAGASS
ncbi:hypothetical protein A7J67_07990 [Achromobacter xylosoxidans]|nr:hypothetical protein A7J67_07990 [Achromobacter xylosoxidans]